MEPIFNQIQQVLGDVFPVRAVEGCFVSVVHGFEDGVDGLVSDAQVQEKIDHPCRGANAALVLEGVALKHGKEDRNGEDKLGHAEAATETADLFNDGFVGQGFAPFDCFVVQVLEQVLPCGFYIGRVAVVCKVEDLQANVVVARRISEDIEQLCMSVRFT